MLDDGSGYLVYKETYNKKSKKKRTKKSKTKKIKTKGKSNAKKVAEKTLKDSLKQEYSINLTVDGDVMYCAGCIIELDSSFGRFEGKYIIEKVTHNIDGDYSCDIEAFKVGARQNAEEKAKAIGDGDSKQSSESVKVEKETETYSQIGETVKDEYFEVTVNSVDVVKSKKINDFESLEAEEGAKYLILNVTFKNIDKESRMPLEGSVFINYNGTNYEYDNTETILSDGWGLYFDQLNPLTAKTTNIVYKIPAEIQGNAIYKPGRGSSEFTLGEIK